MNTPKMTDEQRRVLSELMLEEYESTDTDSKTLWNMLAELAWKWCWHNQPNEVNGGPLAVARFADLATGINENNRQLIELVTQLQEKIDGMEAEMRIRTVRAATRVPSSEPGHVRTDPGSVPSEDDPPAE